MERFESREYDVREPGMASPRSAGSGTGCGGSGTGPNGSGATTVARLIARLLKDYVPDDGCESVVKRLYERAAAGGEACIGRFAKNLFERAKIKQAARIRSLDAGDRVSLASLLPEDFAP